MSVEKRIYFIKRPSSFVSEAPKRNGVVVFDAIPANVRSDDIMFASPSGRVRNHEYLKWYQKTWLTIEKKVRQWLSIS